MSKQGGISSSNSLQQSIRYTTLVVSTIIAFYTALVTANIIPGYGSGDEIHASIDYSLAGLWLVSGIMQFIFFRPSLLNASLRLGWYHILAAVHLLVIAEISSFPFLICWVILAVITYTYTRFPGVFLSATILWIVSVIDGFRLQDNGEVFEYNILMALAISLTISVIIVFIRVQERDDDELKSSQEAGQIQRDSLLTLVNNLTEAVITVSNEGKVLLYNAAAIGLLDTNASILEKPIDQILELYDEHGKKIRVRNLITKAKRVTTNDSLRTLIGEEEVRLELTYSPIRNPDTDNKPSSSSFIVIMRDVTKVKSLEEERDEFISVVSHELRTPIAIAEGAVDNAKLIFEKMPEETDKVSKALAMTHEQVVFLSKMINDLSTLSRAERGVGDEPETIDVQDLVRTAYAEYRPEAAKRSLHLNLHTSGDLGTIYASRLYLQELLQNFITNAIKYTKEGTITIDATAKDNQVTFSVKDTGIGISKADQAKIFDKFYRSEDYRTRETGGTGLGLYVATKLAHKLGCTISLSSRLNHGSTFSFSLPISNKNIKTD